MAPLKNGQKPKKKLKSLVTSGNLHDGFELGEFIVHPEDGRIVGPGGDVRVEPRFMDVLLCLAENAGTVVPREELVQAVWGHLAVTDDSVNRSISQLRQYLGDDPRSPKYVETLPKRGYRLVARVSPLDANTGITPVVADFNEVSSSTADADAASRKRSLLFQLFAGTLAGIAGAIVVVLFVLDKDPDRETPAGFDPPANTIAVMPFEDLSEDKSGFYVGDGLAEDLQTALSRIDGLLVVGRSSAVAARESSSDIRSIGQLLNVGALLEGSVRILGDRIRVATRLVDTRDGYQIWADTFDTELGDVFAIQEELARAVATALEVEFPGSHGLPFPAASTGNFDAYSLYHRGRSYWRERTPESLALAAEYFEQATKMDPEYAVAFAAWSDALVFQHLYGGKPIGEVRPAAELAIAEALKNGPELAEVHASNGLFLSYMVGNEVAARAAHHQSLELNPNSPDELRYHALKYFEEGDFPQATEVLSRALRLDPMNQSVRSMYISVQMSQGNYDEAKAFWMSSPPQLERNAQALRAIASWLGIYGDVASALQWAGHAVEKDPNGPVTLTLMAQLFVQLGELDMAAQWLDRAESAAPGSLNVFVIRAKALAAAGANTELRALIDNYHAARFAESPDSWTYPRYWSTFIRGVVALIDGDLDQAIADLHAVVRISEEEVLNVGPSPAIETRLFLARAYDKSGNERAATKVKAQLREIVSGAESDGRASPGFRHAVASLHALDGNSDAALSVLEDQLSGGLTSGGTSSWKGFWSTGFDPTLDSIRNEPRFAALTVRVSTLAESARSSAVQVPMPGEP